MFQKNIKFPLAEEEVVAFWKKIDAFERSKELSKEREEFILYDGPPFATGLPHYGHILSGTIKDAVGRFMYQQGYRIDRRFGWDCHGLPVEYEIDKRLQITHRQQVLDMGIDCYNEECKAIVMKYSGEWEQTVTRMGRWADFKSGYKTMDRSFMESTWFIFKQLFDRNKIYRGYKVMPFSTACKTPLSNFEANQNYKDVSDPSVLISFPLHSKVRGLDVELVAWTTTPWTLPANCALLVNEAFTYAIFELKGRHYVIQEGRLPEYFKEAQVVERVQGRELVGCEYTQPFAMYEDLRPRGFFRVLAADFVADNSGTAVVHCAPAFGEEDHRVCVQQGLLEENGEAPCPVDENGCFTLDPYQGVYVKDLDKVIIKDLKDRVLMNARIVHSYPFCWRSDTPLIYRLVPNWFIRVRESKDALLRNNELINWIPADIKYKRFHNWLEQCRDWAVGRNRFWGTPLPIWATADFSELLCVGSVDELEALSGVRVEDLHRQYVDLIVIEKDGKTFHRVEEVLDCWFESGSMPYAQDHWPFERRSEGDRTAEGGFMARQRFPSDFIGEGLDQTRGWFYTLHVLATLLFDGPAFKNVNCFGIVLAEDGKKMSKRLKNYPDPQAIFDRHGADALRLYLLSSPVVLAENLRFSEAGVIDINKIVLIPWYNSLAFCMDYGAAGTPDEADQGFGEMCAWISSAFDSFCYSITEVGKSYHLNLVLGHALSFIDSLSNWFIRINRKQLRADGRVLRRLLLDFSIVMAPFTPFFAEYCFQSLREACGRPEESVHHCLYPKTAPSSHPFEKAKNVIDAIRQMREKMKLRLKRPLKSACIVTSPELRGQLKRFQELIKTECNVLELAFGDEAAYRFSMSVKPCFESLRRDMATMKDKMALLRELRGESIMRLARGDISFVQGRNGKYREVSLEDLAIADAGGAVLILKREDAIIERKFVDVENSQTYAEFGVVLDVSVDEEIVEMTSAREFYSFVQRLRKNIGLTVEDAVNVHFDNEYLKKIIIKYYPDILMGSMGDKVGEANYSQDDENFAVEIYKLN